MTEFCKVVESIFLGDAFKIITDFLTGRIHRGPFAIGLECELIGHDWDISSDTGVSMLMPGSTEVVIFLKDLNRDVFDSLAEADGRDNSAGSGADDDDSNGTEVVNGMVFASKSRHFPGDSNRRMNRVKYP